MLPKERRDKEIKEQKAVEVTVETTGDYPKKDKSEILLKEIAEATKEQASQLKKDVSERKKDSIIKKSFKSIKKGSSDIAETSVDKAKNVGRTLLEATPMGKLATMVSDATGISDKISSGIDNSLKKLIKTNEKSSDDISDIAFKTQDSISKATAKITESVESLSTKSPTVDKDNKEQTIQTEKDKSEILLKEIADATKEQTSQLKKDSEERKKDSFIKKSFESIKNGSSDIAETSVSKAKNVGRTLLESTPMGKLTTMVGDTTGISDKVSKGIDNSLQKLIKTNEESSEDISEISTKTQDSITEATAKITETVESLSIPKKPTVDKDVLKEQAIQAEKDKLVFYEMRDYLATIAGKKDTKKSIFKKKTEKKQGVFGNIIDMIGGVFGVIGSLIFKPFKSLGSLIFKPFKSLGSLIFKPFESLGSLIFKPFKSLGSLIFKPFKSLGSLIFKPFESLGSIISKPLKGLGSLISKPLESLGSIISKPLKGLGSLISKPLESLFSGKGGILSKMGDLVKSGVGFAGKGGGKILGGLGKMGGVLTKGLKFLGPVGLALSTVASSISGFMDAESIFGKDATIGNKISATIGGIASGLTLGLVSTETMAKGIQSAADFVADGASWVGDKILQSASLYGKAMSDGADWLGEKLGFGVNSFSNALSNASDYLSKTFDDGILNGFGTIISDTSKLYFDKLKESADSLLSIFGTSTDELGEGLKTFFSDTLNVFSSVGDWFNKKFKNLSDFSDKAVDWFKDKTSSVTDSVISFFSSSKKEKFEPTGNFLNDLNSSIMKEETGKYSGRYGVAKDIGDGAGVSFGAHQLTEKSGGIKEYLKRMSESGDTKATEILKRMGQGVMYNGNKSDLIEYLKKTGNTEEGKKAQEDIYNKRYRDPAIELAKKYGVTDQAAIAQVIDHAVNAGVGGAERMLKKAKTKDVDGIASARKEDYQSLNAYKKYGKVWESRVDRTKDRMKSYEGVTAFSEIPRTEIESAKIISTESPEPFYSKKENIIVAKADTSSKIPPVSIKHTGNFKVRAKQKQQQALQRAQRKQKEISSSESPLELGLDKSNSKAIKSPAPKVGPVYSRTTPVSQVKSSVSDADLLLLSGVFLSK